MQTGDFVKPNPGGCELAGMQCHGIVQATLETLAGAVGAAHQNDPGGEHSMHSWYFETPRGRAVVRDFHTLPRGLLALVSIEPGATRWLARYLRQLRFQTQIHEANDAN